MLARRHCRPSEPLYGAWLAACVLYAAALHGAYVLAIKFGPHASRPSSLSYVCT